MLRLPEFDFIRPDSLEEAAELLAQSPETTRLVAGGTDLWPNMKRRHQSAETVISLAKIERLKGVRQADDGGIIIGASETLTNIAASPLLGAQYPGLEAAINSISSPPLRNTGTLGGNICLDTRCTYYNQGEEWRRSIDYCLKEAGEVCWVAPGSTRCWATSSTDSAPILCALNAELVLSSQARGERRVPIREFYRLDGIDYMDKARDEILVEICLPKAQGALKTTYQKLRRRGSIDFPVLGVGAAILLAADGRVESAEVWLGAVESAPLRADKACDFLIGKTLDEATMAEAGKLARQPAKPMDNTDFIAAWRKKMTERYVVRALQEMAGAS